MNVEIIIPIRAKHYKNANYLVSDHIISAVKERLNAQKVEVFENELEINGDIWTYELSYHDEFIVELNQAAANDFNEAIIRILKIIQS